MISLINWNHFTFNSVSSSSSSLYHHHHHHHHHHCQIPAADPVSAPTGYGVPQVGKSHYNRISIITLIKQCHWWWCWWHWKPPRRTQSLRATGCHKPIPFRRAMVSRRSIFMEVKLVYEENNCDSENYCQNNVGNDDCENNHNSLMLLWQYELHTHFAGGQ